MKRQCALTSIQCATVFAFARSNRCVSSFMVKDTVGGDGDT